MNRLFILVLLALLLSGGTATLIAYDPGYVLISYGKYTIETSIWIGVLVFLLLVFVVSVLLWLSGRSLRRGLSLGRWLRGRGGSRAQLQTEAGLIAFIEGNWKRALKLLEKSAAASATPLLNHLIAARAGQELGDSESVRRNINAAKSSSGQSNDVVALTQAELQLKSGQLESSLATLEKARSNAGKHPYVLKLLQQVYVGLNDWDGLSAILPALYKHKVLAAEDLQQLERCCAMKQLERTVGLVNGDSFARLQTIWDSLSKQLRSEEPIVASYVKALIRLDKQAVAEQVLKTHLRKNWHTDLVRLYGLVIGDDVQQQLLQAESWLKQRTNDAALLLCLGRLALRNELWGKAREYFEASLALESNAEVCAELGRLLAHLGEYELSNDYFHQGLLREQGLPQLPLPEKHQVA